jgi:cell division transport system permease protein
MAVRADLEAQPQVAEVVYVSPAEALRQFKEAHVDDEEILASLEELGETNPLGATLIVRANETEDYQTILNLLNDARYSNLVLNKNFNDYQTIVSQINFISDKIQNVTLAIIGIFTVITILIVFNTIRVAIYTHRQEIHIMRLVGATKKFIRAPYLLEGALYGIIAWIATTILIYPLLNLFQPYINSFFGDQSFNVIGFFNQYFYQIFGAELLAIIIVNILSSSIAINRYLKV